MNELKCGSQQNTEYQGANIFKDNIPRERSPSLIPFLEICKGELARCNKKNMDFHIQSWVQILAPLLAK
jgi:hypothetical protein